MAIDARIPLMAVPQKNAFEAFMEGREGAQQNALSQQKIQSGKNALVQDTAQSIARGVLDSDNPAMAYPQALQTAQAMGMDVSQFPTEWGPDAEMMTKMAAMPAGEQTRVERLISQLKTPEERYRALQIELGMVPGAKTYAPVTGIMPGGQMGYAIPQAGGFHDQPSASPVVPGGGFQPAEPVDRVDTGTGTAPRDPITDQPRGPVTPKDEVTPAVEKERALGEVKAENERRAKAPKIAAQAQESIAVIDQIMQHPALPQMVGPVSSWKPTVSGEGKEFEALLNQLKGRVFLEAREALKGAGPLTDFEMEKGEQALARLDTAQSEEAFIKALGEVRTRLQRAYATAQQEMGGGAAGAAPQIGEIGEGTIAENPETGERIIFQNGEWQPL